MGTGVTISMWSPEAMKPTYSPGFTCSTIGWLPIERQPTSKFDSRNPLILRVELVNLHEKFELLGATLPSIWNADVVAEPQIYVVKSSSVSIS